MASPLKDFCARSKIDFKLERLKGWVENEGADITEDDFLAAFGTEKKNGTAAIAEAEDLIRKKYGGKVKNAA